MSVRVSAAVMRKIMGKAPKFVVGDRVAGYISGARGTVKRISGDSAKVKLDDGRVIEQSLRSWVKV